MPSLSRIAVRNAAAFVVSPGGLEVSMATYSLSRRVTSSRLAGCCLAATEDTKVTKDTKENTNTTRGRGLMLSSVTLVCLRGLGTLLRGFEEAGLTVLAH